MKKRKLIPFRGDRSLWIVVFALLITSLLVVYSSTASYAYANKAIDGDTTYYLFRQVRFIVFSIIVMFIVHWIDFKSYSKYMRTFFYISVILVLVAYFFGSSKNEVSRWISIPFFGSFQPSEMLKITLVGVLAIQLGKRSSIISEIPILPALTPRKWRENPQMNKDIFNRTTKPILLPIVIACLAVFLTNFSTTLLILLISLIVLKVGQVNKHEMKRLLVAGSITGIIAFAIMSATGIGRTDTAISRLESYASAILGDDSPEKTGAIDIVRVDSTDIAKADSIANKNLKPGSVEDTSISLDKLRDLDQSDHAKIAISTGGIIGKGPGNSTQRSQLPLSFSDFAYAFIVEEYGLIGGIVMLVLFLWVFYRSGVIITRCRSASNALLVLGLSLTITIQALVNMVVCVGLTPVTGQPLPLVSMGGSSVLFTCIAFGMILSVSRQNDEEDAEEARQLREAALAEQNGDTVVSEEINYDDSEQHTSEFQRNSLNSEHQTPEYQHDDFDSEPQNYYSEEQDSEQYEQSQSTKPSGIVSGDQAPNHSTDISNDSDTEFTVIDRNTSDDSKPNHTDKDIVDLY